MVDSGYSAELALFTINTVILLCLTVWQIYSERGKPNQIQGRRPSILDHDKQRLLALKERQPQILQNFIRHFMSEQSKQKFENQPGKDESRPPTPSPRDREKEHEEAANHARTQADALPSGREASRSLVVQPPRADISPNHPAGDGSARTTPLQSLRVPPNRGALAPPSGLRAPSAGPSGRRASVAVLQKRASQLHTTPSSSPVVHGKVKLILHRLTVACSTLNLVRCIDPSGAFGYYSSPRIFRFLSINFTVLLILCLFALIYYTTESIYRIQMKFNGGAQKNTNHGILAAAKRRNPLDPSNNSSSTNGSSLSNSSAHSTEAALLRMVYFVSGMLTFTTFLIGNISLIYEEIEHSASAHRVFEFWLVSLCCILLFAINWSIQKLRNVVILQQAVAKNQMGPKLAPTKSKSNLQGVSSSLVQPVSLVTDGTGHGLSPQIGAERSSESAFIMVHRGSIQASSLAMISDAHVAPSPGPGLFNLPPPLLEDSRVLPPPIIDESNSRHTSALPLAHSPEFPRVSPQFPSSRARLSIGASEIHPLHHGKHSPSNHSADSNGPSNAGSPNTGYRRMIPKAQSSASADSFQSPPPLGISIEVSAVNRSQSGAGPAGALNDFSLPGSLEPTPLTSPHQAHSEHSWPSSNPEISHSPDPQLIAPLTVPPHSPSQANSLDSCFLSPAAHSVTSASVGDVSLSLPISSRSWSGQRPTLLPAISHSSTLTTLTPPVCARSVSNSNTTAFEFPMTRISSLDVMRQSRATSASPSHNQPAEGAEADGIEKSSSRMPLSPPMSEAEESAADDAEKKEKKLHCDSESIKLESPELPPSEHSKSIISSENKPPELNQESSIKSLPAVDALTPVDSSIPVAGDASSVAAVHQAASESEKSVAEADTLRVARKDAAPSLELSPATSMDSISAAYRSLDPKAGVQPDQNDSVLSCNRNELAIPDAAGHGKDVRPSVLISKSIESRSGTIDGSHLTIDPAAFTTSLRVGLSPGSSGQSSAVTSPTNAQTRQIDRTLNISMFGPQTGSLPLTQQTAMESIKAAKMSVIKRHGKFRKKKRAKVVNKGIEEIRNGLPRSLKIQVSASILLTLTIVFVSLHLSRPDTDQFSPDPESYEFGPPVATLLIQFATQYLCVWFAWIPLVQPPVIQRLAQTLARCVFFAFICPTTAAADFDNSPSNSPRGTSSRYLDASGPAAARRGSTAPSLKRRKSKVNLSLKRASVHSALAASARAMAKGGELANEPLQEVPEANRVNRAASKAIQRFKKNAGRSRASQNLSAVSSLLQSRRFSGPHALSDPPLRPHDPLSVTSAAAADLHSAGTVGQTVTDSTDPHRSSDTNFITRTVAGESQYSHGQRPGMHSHSNTHLIQPYSPLIQEARILADPISASAQVSEDRHHARARSMGTSAAAQLSVAAKALQSGQRAASMLTGDAVQYAEPAVPLSRPSFSSIGIRRQAGSMVLAAPMVQEMSHIREVSEAPIDPSAEPSKSHERALSGSAHSSIAAPKHRAVNSSSAMESDGESHRRLTSDPYNRHLEFPAPHGQNQQSHSRSRSGSKSVNANAAALAARLTQLEHAMSSFGDSAAAAHLEAPAEEGENSGDDTEEDLDQAIELAKAAARGEIELPFLIDENGQVIETDPEQQHEREEEDAEDAEEDGEEDDEEDEDEDDDDDDDEADEDEDGDSGSDDMELVQETENYHHLPKAASMPTHHPVSAGSVELSPEIEQALRASLAAADGRRVRSQDFVHPPAESGRQPHHVHASSSGVSSQLQTQRATLRASASDGLGDTVSVRARNVAKALSGDYSRALRSLKRQMRSLHQSRTDFPTDPAFYQLEQDDPAQGDVVIAVNDSSAPSEPQNAKKSGALGALWKSAKAAIRGRNRS